MFAKPLVIAACFTVGSLALAGATSVPASATDFRAAWELGPTGTQASLRAVSAPDNSTLWAAGSGGTVIRSTDGGSSWSDCSPPGYGELEFRSLHAWDRDSACVASAGAPAVVLRTDDRGQTWRVVYQHAAPQAFFDALRFWDRRHGLAFSDPIEQSWLIIETADGGRHWEPIAAEHLPSALDAEAGFAASNSSLCLGSNGAAWIGTGGAQRATSRVHFRIAWNTAWRTAECPIPSSVSSGIFSIACIGERVVAVGGDYRPGATSAGTAAWSNDAGQSWHSASAAPASFRSAVAAIPPSLLNADGLSAGYIATGPTGTDFSLDGDSWTELSEVGFHALATPPDAMFAVGANGRFARLTAVP